MCKNALKRNLAKPLRKLNKKTEFAIKEIY